jgi:hypothetical protein
MACKIDKRDVETALRVEIMNKYKDAMPTNFGHSVSLIRNKNFNYREFESFISSLNKKYGEATFGKALDIKQSENTITVDFNVSEKLVNNIQNNNIKNSFNQKRDFSFSIFENTETKPETDNFVEFIRYQKQIIERNKILIQEYKSKIKRKEGNKDSLNKKIRELYMDINSREETLSNLEKNSEENLFKALFEEIDQISKAIDNVSDIENIKQRLEFIYKFVKGVSMDNTSNEPIIKTFILENAEYPNLNLQLDNLVRKYNDSLEALAYKIISDDITFYNNVLSREDEFTEEQIKGLFHATSDINALEKALLGLSQASTNDTVIPSIIQSYLNTHSTKRNSEVKKYSDRLRELIDKIDSKDFSFIFERNERGNLTGNLIDIHTEKYRKVLKRYYDINNEIISNEAKYKKKLSWIKQNVHIIDFRKISQVQEIYKDLYPEEYTFTEEETKKYEQFLKDLLGDFYQEEIEKVLETLESFETIKNNREEVNTKDFDRYIAQNNPYLFIKQFGTAEENDTVSFKNSSGDIEEVWSKINYIRFVPKKEVLSPNEYTGEFEKVSTGYYNSEFEKNILSDINKFNYWKLLKEIYTEYINPTYNINSYNDMSYAKIEKSFLEELKEQQNLALKGGKTVKKAMYSFKSIFYERGFQSDLIGIRKNYQDNFKKQVVYLSKIYQSKSLEELISLAKKEGINISGLSDKKDIIKEIATAKVITNYSMDINSITGALLDMAALHKARQDTAPIARVLAEAHKLNDPNRKNSIERVNKWIDRVIYNYTEFERGSESLAGRDFKISKQGWFKTLIEKVVNVPFIKSIISSKFLKLLDDSEKEMFKLLLDIKNKGYKNSEKYTVRDEKDNLMYIKAGNSYFVQSGQHITAITEEQFDKAFQNDIQDKIDALGVDLNAAGLIQGMLKLIIFKGLGLAPIAGIFNRIEGFNSSYIMDATGNYWTTGNFERANSFMAFYNSLKISPERMSSLDLKRFKELKKFRILLNSMAIIQDRKNELQRNASFSKFNTETLNPFQFAVELPETHNQGAILLCILMDAEIKDKNGNTHKIFDKDKLEFTIYDEADKKLFLKEEFRTEENIANWENFEVDLENLKNNSYLLTKNKAKQAISRSQGNYDNLDVINITSSLWGRVISLFLKWMPEHFMQRFSGGYNFNIWTGEQGAKGRYREIWGNKGNLTFFAIMKVLLKFGLTPFSTGLSLGVTGLVSVMGLYKIVKGRKGLETQATLVQDLANFLQTMVIQTLNYPLTLFRSKYAINSFKISEKIYGKNYNAREVQAMAALCRELAVQIAWLVVIALIKKLFWKDKDDEEYDENERQLQNFLDNQASRIISTLDNYSNPVALITDLQRNSLLRELTNIQKFASAIIENKDKKDIEKAGMKVVPLPKLLIEGTDIFRDEKEFDTNWVDEKMKDVATDGEYSAKKELKKLRQEKTLEIIKNLEEKGLEGEAFDKEFKKEKRRYLLKRKKGETYKSVIERMKNGETNKIREDKPKSKKRKPRKNKKKTNRENNTKEKKEKE